MDSTSRTKILLRERFEKPLDVGFDKATGFVEDFKKFAVKGNVMDLAVGIVIGSAFTSIVNSLVKDIIMPVFGALTGNLDFADYYINLSSTPITNLAEAEEAGLPILRYGVFINSIVTFLIVSFALYIVVKYFLREKEKEQKIEEIRSKKCPSCFEDVKLNATKCKFCTAPIPLDKVKATEKIQKTEAMSNNPIPHNL